MNKILVFTAPWCAACLSEMPRIKQAANKLGLTVQEVNVDRCPVNLKNQCDAVSWVPTVMLDGREVTVPQLEGMAANR